MRVAAYKVAVLCWLWSSLAICDGGPSEKSGEDAHQSLVGVDAANVRASCIPLNSTAEYGQPQFLVYEIRQLEVVLAEDGHVSDASDTQRHLDEKKRLLEKMDKKHGTWNEHHPRYRLLEALRGFAAYAESQQAELDRLKGLYSYTSRKQKAVSVFSEANWLEDNC
jgi:hypothetical protein